MIERNWMYLSNFVMFCKQDCNCNLLGDLRKCKCKYQEMLFLVYGGSLTWVCFGRIPGASRSPQGNQKFEYYFVKADAR